MENDRRLFRGKCEGFGTSWRQAKYEIEMIALVELQGDDLAIERQVFENTKVWRDAELRPGDWVEFSARVCNNNTLKNPMKIRRLPKGRAKDMSRVGKQNTI